MIISQYFPIIGGTEKQAKLLTQKLIQKGIDVHILTGWWDIRSPRKEFVDGIKVLRNFSCWGMFGIKGILRYLGGLIYMFTLGLYLLTHRREYDIIHVHQALYPAFISVLVGKSILGKPVIVKTASSGITSDILQLRKFPLGRYQLNYLLKKMELLVAVNRIGGDEYKQIGFPEERILFIPNGVEVSEEAKTDYTRMKSILAVSRFSYEKGIDILLRAWAIVVKEEKNLRLIFLGDGPLLAAHKKLTESLGISESIVFQGAVQKVTEYYRTTDLFVLPSRTEGLSNALLEAMNYGIPCIATNVGGNGELLRGGSDSISSGEYVVAQNGLLVNPEDVEGLSKAMLYFIRDKKARETLGIKGMEFIQAKYSIDRIADQYIELYLQMLKGRS